MDSVTRLIDQTMEQVKQAARNNEGRDPISRPHLWKEGRLRDRRKQRERPGFPAASWCES